MNLLKSFPKSIIFLWLFLIFGSIYLFNESMDKYPAYLHAWTQSDRLAIAQNFQNNGFDFFHPATYNLYTKDGVTQVDFPIHDYIVAILGEVFQKDIVSTFRWYNLVWSIIGFSFLYLSFLRLNPSQLRALFLTLFIATLPFYVYYQNGFLPSTTSISTLFIALYFVLKAIEKKKMSHFLVSAFFIGLSALSRSTFVFQLMGFGLVIIFTFFKNKNTMVKALLPYFLMAVAFISYYFYNRSLSEEYGSMFLQEFLNIRSLDEFVQIIVGATDRWSDHFLSPFHAAVLIGVFIAALFQFKNAKPNPKVKAIAILLINSIVCSLVFFFLMGRQFVDHDYYYLSVLVPSLTYLLIFANQYISISKNWYTPIATICGIFLFYFYSQSKQVQAERYTPAWDDRIEYAYNVYDRAIDDIKSWGIDDNDTLTILEANSTNIPFSLWNKKGYTNLNSKAEIVDSILNYPKQYVVLIDSFFRLDAFRDYPEIIDRLELVHTNGEVSFYTDHPKDESSVEFFKNHIYSTHIYFESSTENLEKFNGYQIRNHQKSNVNHIEKSSVYNMTYSDTLKNLKADAPIQISLVADYFPTDTATSIQLVCQSGEFYFTHYLENTLDFAGKWKTKQYDFKISPNKFREGNEIKIYYWNPEGKELLIDNYHLIIYQ